MWWMNYINEWDEWMRWINEMEGLDEWMNEWGSEMNKGNWWIKETEYMIQMNEMKEKN